MAGLRWRMESMSKYGNFGAYPQRSLLSAEAALLTVWPSLSRYHDDLVLVGGLAIHYLTRRDIQGMPGAITLDVDLGISLASSGGQYGTIRSDLEGLGFVSEGQRHVRRTGDIALYIDFLTEDPNQNALGSRVVDDVVANVVPGINRASACYRTVLVEGTDVYGAEQKCQVKVADVGPLLVLKLNAFGGLQGRRLPKDAYDILLTVTGFVDGPAAAIKSFWAEQSAKNPAYRVAIRVLEKDFSEIKHECPVRAAEFLGQSGLQREQIRQDLVTVATPLLRTAVGG
jgi:predicted nucleotidyltransferase